MARYRIAVCDDEPSELEDIVQSVKRYDVHGDFDIENYTDGAVLLSDLQLKKNFFDLLLLDIEMPSNGFQIAQTLTQMEKHPLVIFVTKRHEYAVQGYGIAFRYLVKPLDKSLLLLQWMQSSKNCIPNTLPLNMKELRSHWKHQIFIIWKAMGIKS